MDPGWLPLEEQAKRTARLHEEMVEWRRSLASYTMRLRRED